MRLCVREKEPPGARTERIEGYGPNWIQSFSRAKDFYSERSEALLECAKRLRPEVGPGGPFREKFKFKSKK